MTQTAPKPRPGIMNISAYVPGKSALPSGKTPIKLSSNETPLGPSPRAIDAYRAIEGALERYPDGQSGALREAIGARYGLDAARIVCGAGSDELLNLLAQAYLGAGDEAIYTQHGFLVYKIAIQATGAAPIVAPEHEFTADVDAIMSQVSSRTKMVFLANPNNPTGTYLPIDEVRRLRAELPDQILLVLDAAYGEYVRRNDYEAGLELVATTNNTVMTRTFSKVYGLASLRVGWAYCPAAIADVLNRIRGPFNVGAPAIAAATAAIQDVEFLDKAVAFNDIWRDWLSAELAKLELSVTPSVGNFLLVHFPDEPGRDAAAADQFLLAKSIIVRRVAGYGLPGALRITIGTEEENRAVIAALAQFTRDQFSSGKSQNTDGAAT